MIAPHPAQRAHAPRGLIAPPEHYCCVPQRLLTDLHDTPVAIGLYALVARLYLIEQSPVPLSRADVQRYDPSLKVGAVKRALDRLLDRGWLIAAPAEGQHKQRYTPSWGRIKGAPLPWRMDAPCLGRPRHIVRQLLDRSLLDVCMGKITPHPTQAATISRYVTTPALSLADVGSYALALAGQPRETPALQRLGLVRSGEARPVPSEARLLALISQRALLDDAGEDMALTASGTRRLGVAPAPQPAERAQPLFFVPPELIGNVIGGLIGKSIGRTSVSEGVNTAAESAKPLDSHAPRGITWESGNQANQANPPPTPSLPTDAAGGGSEQRDQKKARACRRGGQTDKRLPTVPVTPATKLLQTINVLPEVQIELANLPAETIKAAIQDAQARPEVRDQAGWVVKLLRTHRDHGWKIVPPAPRAATPEDLRLAFARHAAAQEAERRAGMPEDAPWFPPAPPPALLHTPGGITRLWGEVQSSLKAQLPRTEFSLIRHATLVGVEQGVATIQAPSQTVKTALEDRHLGALRDLLALFAGELLQVRVTLNPHASRPTLAVPTTDALPAEPTLTPNSQLPAPNSQPPSWITPERWAALPAMLRAALVGSELEQGQVRGRDAFVSRLLETRHRREVDALLAEAPPR